MNIALKNSLEPVIAEELSAHAGIKHGFFTRIGGVSTGICASLNTGLGSKDSRDCVRENRARIATSLGIFKENLVGCHQVHSSDVVTVSGPVAESERPIADALVTNRPGLGLSVLTADCGPVLFADSGARVIGAAHAGWRGAFGGVLANTINAMVNLGATRENIVAILGPTISADHYEVGPEFVERFLIRGSSAQAYFTSSPNIGHQMFNLPAFILDELHACSVNAFWTGQCTYADEDRFFSYRRTTHRREPDYGRQMSTIVLT